VQFTRLRLSGFKSFVDPTELVIQDGLTGVVGPNGCGKSNLLEALRWIMGENRPTAMRGDGMEDVIFAGAATRGARNFAEVALVIDNGERLAPAGFNDQDALEITRRVTRNVGSAYKVNGRDVRARDVQMLFADASTGAQSPALVRQGQIAELINARPKNRRRILEEAAGISGLYQRRHEAELKLTGTEQNLSRVDDVLDGLTTQLASLDRQVRQADRYRVIATELRRAEGIALFLRWRAADAAQADATADLRRRISDAAQAEQVARAASETRARADDALPPHRDEDAIAAAVLQRLMLQRDALTRDAEQVQADIARMTARAAQITQDRDRETALNRDAGDMMARLAWEKQELTRAGDGHADRLAAASDTARNAAAALQDREAVLAQQTEDMARLSARHHSAQRLLDDTRKTLARSETEAERARATVNLAQAAVAAAKAAEVSAQSAEATAQTTARNAETTLSEADAARGDTQAREAEARAERSEAEGELNALRAEASALGRLLQRDTAEGGQIIDRLQVEQGFEKALGAALADDLRAPEVGADGRSGWAELPGYAAVQPLPDGVTPLSRHVSVPGVLERRMGQIGLIGRADAARLQPLLRPGQRLVTTEGDLWRWDGFRAAAEDAPTAAALRLEQLNRLEVLKQQLARATARAEGARAAHETLTARLARLAQADQAARNARREADRLVAEAARAVSRAEADSSLAQARLESAGLAVVRHSDEADAARRGVIDGETQLAGLDDVGAARASVEAARQTVATARSDMLAARSAQDELRRAGEARTRRLQDVEKDLTGWQQRLDTARSRDAALTAQQAETDAALLAALALPGDIAARRATLSNEITRADGRKAAAAQTLSAAETALRLAQGAERDAERLAADAREARARSEARAEAATGAAKLAILRIAEDLDLTPGALLTQIGGDPDAFPVLDVAEADITRLKRQREALGAVNLRAEEDAREVVAERDALAGEKADLEDAIRALRSGIAGLNREGRERLLTAFEGVNVNFSLLFTHLFGGGEASLVLVESEDPLEAGLEIMCQPPGKKLSTLSLLSGGEQTLTALALIFAVFLANPAPICVLDEVDAPLDDANVTRFCDLLDEMARRTATRFLIITHHAVTMARMDRLFGVTMQEQGVSQLVSVDLKKAAALVA
jgi:chromosome segregation protein